MNFDIENLRYIFFPKSSILPLYDYTVSVVLFSAAVSSVSRADPQQYIGRTLCSESIRVFTAVSSDSYRERQRERAAALRLEQIHLRDRNLQDTDRTASLTLQSWTRASVLPACTVTVSSALIGSFANKADIKTI